MGRHVENHTCLFFILAFLFCFVSGEYKASVDDDSDDESKAVTRMEAENSLFQYIADPAIYQRLTVPRGEDGAVTVHHALFLNRILDVRWTWPDARLGELLGAANIDKLEVPVDLLWIPDIILYNSAGNPDNVYHVKARVSNDGNVTYLHPAHVQSFCSMPDAFSKNEILSCKLLFGSWVYDSSTLKLSADDHAQLDLFADFDREWALVDTTCAHFELNRYSVAVYTLNLNKK
ncbi:ACHA2-like protein [Mya arenaria]|uniref:ACHA2-like protein n=1 Tax=Mya arenaria TaxID=6604 RepID=A0ABY7E2C9_MYAAR|nr:ACHA2-like protein [Mya arenaria]